MVYSLPVVPHRKEGFIMSRINSERKNCKDVFNAFLVRLACFAGLFEFPVLKPTYCIPNRLLVFSKAISSKDYDYWV